MKILLINTNRETIIIIITGFSAKWIDKDFGLQLVFLLLGVYIGKWFENGKK